MEPRSGQVAAVVVVALLAVAALVAEARLPAVVACATGVLLVPARSPWRWAFAAGLPVALILAFGWAVADRLLVGPFECADPLSPVAWARALEAALVIGTVLVLAVLLRERLADLGLRRPSRIEVALGIGAIALIPLPSLYLGTILAEPFFGPIELDLSEPLAIVPALTLAVANGTMEELAYRGALMHWLSRAAGPTAGLVGQAIVFGLAHNGPDFTGPALPVMLAIMAGGLIAGLIVRRSGSLWLPIIVHICFDVPLYHAAACRLI